MPGSCCCIPKMNLSADTVLRHPWIERLRHEPNDGAWIGNSIDVMGMYQDQGQNSEYALGMDRRCGLVRARTFRRALYTAQVTRDLFQLPCSVIGVKDTDGGGIL